MSAWRLAVCYDADMAQRQTRSCFTDTEDVRPAIQRNASVAVSPASLRMISTPGCLSSPSDTRRISEFAQAAVCSLSRQRLMGSLKSDPPLNTCIHAVISARLAAHLTSPLCLLGLMLTGSNLGRGDAHLLQETEKVVHRGHVCSKLQLTHFLGTSKGEDKAATLLHSDPALANSTAGFVGQTFGGAGAIDHTILQRHYMPRGTPGCRVPRSRPVPWLPACTPGRAPLQPLPWSRASSQKCPHTAIWARDLLLA